MGQDLYDNISRVGFFGDKEAIEIFFTLELYKLSGPYAKLYNLDIIRRHNLRYPDDISLGEDLIFTLSYLNVVDKIYLRNISNYHIVRRNNSLNFSSSSIAAIRSIASAPIKKYLNVAIPY